MRQVSVCFIALLFFGCDRAPGGKKESESVRRPSASDFVWEQPRDGADHEKTSLQDAEQRKSSKVDNRYPLRARAFYYTTSPQQGRAADGELPAGTTVEVVEKAGSYWRIRTADGLTAFVDADALTPSPLSAPAESEAIQAASAPIGDTARRLPSDRSNIGDDRRPVSSLIKELKSEQATSRDAAIEQLETIGRADKDLVPALTEGLKDEDPLVRLYLVRAVGRIGPEAKSAVPALTDLLTSELAANAAKKGHSSLIPTPPQDPTEKKTANKR